MILMLHLVIECYLKLKWNRNRNWIGVYELQELMMLDVLVLEVLRMWIGIKNDLEELIDDVIMMMMNLLMSFLRVLVIP